MSEIIWRPYGDYLERSRIRDFMRLHGLGSYEELVHRSTSDLRWFWPAALEHLGVQWDEPYRELLDESGGLPWCRWFVGGRLNIVTNCLDRHLAAGRGEQPALLYESEEGEVRCWRYADLAREVGRVAAALRAEGLSPGDTVGIYMPMGPEVVAAFFGALKIGAVPVPIFSAFGWKAVAMRLQDAEAKVLFTADGAVRRGKRLPLKPEADRAAAEVPALKRVVVWRRTGEAVPMTPGRDVTWEAYLGDRDSAEPTESLPAEATSMILFTSGTTGRPKGCVHTHAGALAQIAKEVGYAFDVKEGDRFFWVTDIGWMMGPWMLIGALFHGASVFITDAPPNYPEPDRLWAMVARHRLTHLGISPTAIRLLRTYGEEWLRRHDLSSLRYLGSTGEPWDPESYLWFFEQVGGGKLPIINISGGTEIVGCLLSPYPITELKPCTLRGPGLGMDVDVVDDEGRSLPVGMGHLICRKPAPSMTKGFLKDPQRYLDTYFARFPGVWFHGDWAERDADGFWFLRGRSDDTIKVAGKRTGPAEIEAAALEHPAVAEAAAVGVPHPVKGEGVVLFVVPRPGSTSGDLERFKEEVKDTVVAQLGRTLRPEKVLIVEALPKTRSAKIVRGALRAAYLGEPLPDLSSVENPEALAAVRRAR